MEERGIEELIGGADCSKPDQRSGEGGVPHQDPGGYREFAAVFLQ